MNIPLKITGVDTEEVLSEKDMGIYSYSEEGNFEGCSMENIHLMADSFGIERCWIQKVRESVRKENNGGIST